ncbi:endoplasmic reticulum-Golgi intermediate compartment protein 1 isoform X2 [Parambassis ranga]|uniref:Endoplasmic reticulum-Golgi intermediate compartment protein n=1 Tax=Parambassis ranga TaxID=210632 RepID=A0A6P7J4Q5_9TELE|nr:endoplasmic reticulum-Golgi intermediate compartment protein 1 isoform X2 [Parambassis ranga]
MSKVRQTACGGFSTDPADVSALLANFLPLKIGHWLPVCQHAAVGRGEGQWSVDGKTQTVRWVVGLDIQDEMGRHEVGHIDNSMKIPLNHGAGCRFEGEFTINKVPGNFHVSTHSATAQPQNPDMTHTIHKLAFGEKLQVQKVQGAFNALGGANKLSSNPLASYDYILKIVPTVYEDLSGKQRFSYQYTVANKEYVAYSHTGRIIPAIWFRYDLSPITVKYTERRQPFYRFITTICAIVGGTFTVAGIIDSCIFTASEAWKKIQIGKMS